jgi:hypothetical protein
MIKSVSDAAAQALPKSVHKPAEPLSSPVWDKKIKLFFEN